MLNHLTTEERNPDSAAIDTLTALEIVALMNREDARVAAAVATQLRGIAQAVELIVQRLERGGRLLYIGAGTSGRLGVLDAAECPPTFSTPPERVVGIIAGGAAALTRAVEGAEDHPELARRDLEACAVSADDGCGVDTRSTCSSGAGGSSGCSSAGAGAGRRSTGTEAAGLATASTCDSVVGRGAVAAAVAVAAGAGSTTVLRSGVRPEGSHASRVDANGRLTIASSGATSVRMATTGGSAIAPAIATPRVASPAVDARARMPRDAWRPASTRATRA